MGVSHPLLVFEPHAFPNILRCNWFPHSLVVENAFGCQPFVRAATRVAFLGPRPHMKMHSSWWRALNDSMYISTMIPFYYCNQFMSWIPFTEQAYPSIGPHGVDIWWYLHHFAFNLGRSFQTWWIWVMVSYILILFNSIHTTTNTNPVCCRVVSPSCVCWFLTPIV